MLPSLIYRYWKVLPKKKDKDARIFWRIMWSTQSQKNLSWFWVKVLYVLKKQYYIIEKNCMFKLVLKHHFV